MAKYLRNLTCTALFSMTLPMTAAAEESEVQDMSDPLAVYTQAGLGYTDKGINVKVGQTYDTGSDTSMGMNVLEIKGFAGEALGWNGRGADDSIDSIRFRNFTVDLTNGRGGQVDISWDFDSNQGSASYSFIQALPKIGMFNFYPLAGLGVAAGEELVPGTGGDLDADQVRDRYNLHGSFYVAGMYSKMQLTDNFWLNYNPMYMVLSLVHPHSRTLDLREIARYLPTSLQPAINLRLAPISVTSLTGPKTPTLPTVTTVSSSITSFNPNRPFPLW
ncbi:hypothetical protein JCM19231_3624 [Vibrio ishigakensis]|uniref:Uncharacterized protein n=1 Tax=Vibrio ishigakensis TaxID=1481914 RepID=A0A0B8NTN7_9VIBR|nr:hypothetical protein JCM19231_3624 [Vibrio ishigakensis]